MNLPDEARRSALFADFKWADADGKSLAANNDDREESSDDGDVPELLFDDDQVFVNSTMQTPN
jgi:hypothetical protein